MNNFISVALILALAGLTFFIFTSKAPMATNSTEPAPIEKAPIPDNAAVATVAGGCFWCIEAAYEGGMAGVYEAVSGYAGGKANDATYRLVSQGDTAHREGVQVFYDPEVVSYAEILDVYWRQIDPTDPDGQFADRGFHYTTAIYYHDEEQKQVAETAKKTLGESDRFDKPIVTEILPFTSFYPAEESHQDFARKKAGYYDRYKTGSGRAGFIEREWGK